MAASAKWLLIGFITAIITACSCIYESPTVDECKETLSCTESAAQLIRDLGLDIDLSKCSSNPVPPTTTTTTTTEPTTTTTTTTPTTTTTTTTTTTPPPPPPPTPTTDFPVFARAFTTNQTGGCANDFMECACFIGLIGEALSVKFRFGCDLNLRKHESCDLWKYFELYLLCNATDELIPDKHILWDDDQCKAEGNHLHKCCGSDTCTFSHKPDNPCKIFTSPVECLNEPKCGYCFDPCLCSADGARCNTKANLDVIGCKARTLEAAESQTVDIDTTCSNNETVTISIAPGQKKNVTFTFQLQKHPLDFYYLMDFTGTMQDDKVFLQRMAPSLVEKLESLTTDLRVGFGSFLDKPIPPFGVTSDIISQEDLYSFKNSLPLTDQTRQLQVQMEGTKTVALPGAEFPEDAGDGLIQIAECTKEIGWRDDARHIVLVATDETFHLAGDAANIGKLDLAPYAHGCYLDSNGRYTEETRFDYPSIAQIAHAAAQNKIIVIFAVDKKIEPWFASHTAPIKGSVIAELSGDSSNIIDIVEQEFNKFNSKLEIEKSPTTDTVKYRFFSSCAQKNGDQTETSFCENLPPEGNVKFTVEVDMAECPKDKAETETKVIFNPVGIPDFKRLAIAHVC